MRANEKEWEEQLFQRNNLLKFAGIRCDHVPFKVQITSWRLILNRLTTKENLVKRNVIDLQVAVCCGCKRETETADHLFLGCSDIAKLWNEGIINWLTSMHTVMPFLFYLVKVSSRKGLLDFEHTSFEL